MAEMFGGSVGVVRSYICYLSEAVVILEVTIKIISMKTN